MTDITDEQIRAESLWEELGGDLCICQRSEVMHWCESCQRKIQLIREAVLVRTPVAPPEPVIQHIQQEDDCGCLVACLAMVTQHTYAEIRDYFVGLGKTFDGERGGIHEYDAEQYLSDHAFVFARKYKWIGANIPRERWPARPFAPVHILGVRGGGAHGVVMLHDGTVFDPFYPEPKTILDYPDIAYMIGVWNLRELAAARLPVAPPADPVCFHGTALDVHCCHCHSGFIFDKDHMCPEPTNPLQQIAERAMIAQSDPHAAAESYRQALRDICNFALKEQDRTIGETPHA